jgi:hypothetical protein
MRENRKNGQIALFIVLVVIAFLSFACNLSRAQNGSTTPGSTGSQGTPGSQGSSSSLLPQPAIGLAALQSYQVTFHQDVTGSLDGKPFERHSETDLTRAGTSGDYDLTSQIQGSAEPSTYQRLISISRALYRWAAADQGCSGTFNDQPSNPATDPASLLLPVYQASQVGSETVNGIAAIHYHFDQHSLNLADTATPASGEVWIAAQGGYVVKYTLNIQAPAQPDPDGLQAAQTWSYEVSQVNAISGIDLPDGCLPVLTDIPVMTDAQDLMRGNGMTGFTTASSAAQVVSYFIQNLPPLGWKNDQAAPQGDVNLPFIMTFTKDNQSLSLTLDKGDPSGVEVTLALSSSSAQAAETPASQTPVTNQGSQPTANPSESSLPSDIPSYPGSTELANQGVPAIMLQTADSATQVAQFYNQQMAANNWALLSNTTTGGVINQGWQKDTRMAMITIQPVGSITKIIIAVQNE